MNRRIVSSFPSSNVRLFIALMVLAMVVSNRLHGNELEEIRLTRLRDLNSHCPMKPPATKDDWEKRAEYLRLQVRVALGIHPMPTLSNEAPTIHGRRDMDGYSIEKVYFESLPGFFVTGSLYRPLVKAASNKHPLVLLPHGHWEEGRFYNAPPGEVSKLLASGAERFENAAINHMQAQCVQLARMGIVVFQYDMIGYADSKQLSFELAHGFGMVHADTQSTDLGWRLFSPIAEGYNQSIMGLQTINTIQAVNLIGSLEDVDSSRIAITGASGGGTQSLIAIAVEPRIAGAFPAVMVSTGMQGGCTCENACGLRIGTGNVEIVALAAPRPVGITAADDWTRDIAADGFPELKKVYELYGKSENVMLFSATQFPHNYNHLSRGAMYGWVNRIFGLGFSEPILERDFELLHKPELTVWDAEHPAPPGGLEFECRLLKAWGTDIDQGIRSTAPQSVVDGWRVMTQPLTIIADSLKGELQLQLDRKETDYVIRNGEGMIVARARSIGKKTLKDASSTDRLKVRLASSDKSDGRSDRESVDFEVEVILVDPVIADGTLIVEQPLVANPRPSASYTFGYNPAQSIRKSGVLLAVSRFLHQHSPAAQDFFTDSDNVALGLVAKLQEPTSFDNLYRLDDSDGLKFQDALATPIQIREIQSIRDPYFLPGGLRYGGIEGLVDAIKQSH